MPSSRDVIACSCLIFHYLDLLKIKARSLSAYVSLAEVNDSTHKTAAKHKILFVCFNHSGCSEKLPLYMLYVPNSFVVCCFGFFKNKREESGFPFLETVTAWEYLGSFLCD